MKPAVARWLALGLCSKCGGKEPLLPGIQYGERCRELQRQRELTRNRPSRAIGVNRAEKDPLPEPPQPPEVSIWDLDLTRGIEDAILEADWDMNIQP